jgi:hypothetical protein
VFALGVVAVICVIGVFKLASAPASDTTRTKVTSPAPTGTGAGGSAGKGPQVTEVAAPQDSTGLSILGTIGSAAVGGIAGMLTTMRSSGKSDPPQRSEVPAAGE